MVSSAETDPETGLAVRLGHITGERAVQSWANTIPCPEQVAVARLPLPMTKYVCRICHLTTTRDRKVLCGAYVISVPFFVHIRHHLHDEYVLWAATAPLMPIWQLSGHVMVMFGGGCKLYCGRRGGGKRVSHSFACSNLTYHGHCNAPIAFTNTRPGTVG